MGGGPAKSCLTGGTPPRYLRQSAISCSRAEAGADFLSQKQTLWMNMGAIVCAGAGVATALGEGEEEMSELGSFDGPSRPHGLEARATFERITGGSPVPRGSLCVRLCGFAPRRSFRA